MNAVFQTHVSLLLYYLVMKCVSRTFFIPAYCLHPVVILRLELKTTKTFFIVFNFKLCELDIFETVLCFTKLNPHMLIIMLFKDTPVCAPKYFNFIKKWCLIIKIVMEIFRYKRLKIGVSRTGRLSSAYNLHHS